MIKIKIKYCTYFFLLTSRFEARGLKLVALKMMNASEIVLTEHYAHLQVCKFYVFFSQSQVVTNKFYVIVILSSN